jgi:hypothetical protein
MQPKKAENIDSADSSLPKKDMNTAASHAKKVKFHHESEIEEDVTELPRNYTKFNGDDFLDTFAEAGKKPRRRVLKEDGLSDSDGSNSESENEKAQKIEGEKDIGEEDDVQAYEEDVDMFRAEPVHYSRLSEEVPMTPFNLNEEREEGNFDNEGNFIWHSESDRDELLEPVIKTAEERASAKEVQIKAFQAQQKRKLDIEQKEKEWETFEQTIGLGGIIKELLGFLEGRETPLQALKRLAPSSVKKSLVRRYVKPNSETASLDDSSNKAKIDRITSLCSDAIALSLLSRFCTINALLLNDF